MYKPLISICILLIATVASAQVSFISGVTSNSVFVNTHTPKEGVLVHLQSETGENLATKAADYNTKWDYSVVEFKQLKGNTDYMINVVIGNKTEVLPFTTQPSKKNKNLSYSFATGSCSYINDSSADRPGKPYGGDYEIFETIAGKNPEFMLWLGDNIYLRNDEWDNAEGVRYRYKTDRATPELQTLLRSCPQYAIWDDHDFGPNDEDSTYENASMTLEGFQANWGSLAYASKQGMGKFSYPELDFFLLDNRSHRAPNNLQDTTKPYFGKKQLMWLLDELEKSGAEFKIIAAGGQILNTDRVYENYSNYAVERRWLLNELSKRKIKNVVFLTGDRHRSEVSKLKMESGFTVYDFTVSSLTSKTYPSRETNKLVVPESEISVKNFATITYNSASKASLTFTFYSTNGSKLKEYTVKAE
jgi:alkaline phosphatase D